MKLTVLQLLLAVGWATKDFDDEIFATVLDLIRQQPSPQVASKQRASTGAPTGQPSGHLQDGGRQPPFQPYMVTDPNLGIPPYVSTEAAAQQTGFIMPDILGSSTGAPTGQPSAHFQDGGRQPPFQQSMVPNPTLGIPPYVSTEVAAQQPTGFIMPDILGPVGNEASLSHFPKQTSHTKNSELTDENRLNINKGFQITCHYCKEGYDQFAIGPHLTTCAKNQVSETDLDGNHNNIVVTCRYCNRPCNRGSMNRHRKQCYGKRAHDLKKGIFKDFGYNTQCEYCHDFFAENGMVNHNRRCRHLKYGDAKNDSASISENEQSYSRRSNKCPYCLVYRGVNMSKHYKYCPKIRQPVHQAASASESSNHPHSGEETNAAKTVDASESDKRTCPYCNRRLHFSGLGSHMKTCQRVHKSDKASASRSSNNPHSGGETNAEKPLDAYGRMMVECPYCNLLYKTYGLERHMRSCKPKQARRIESASKGPGTVLQSDVVANAEVNDDSVKFIGRTTPSRVGLVQRFPAAALGRPLTPSKMVDGADATVHGMIEKGRSPNRRNLMQNPSSPVSPVHSRSPFRSRRTSPTDPVFRG